MSDQGTVARTGVPLNASQDRDEHIADGKRIMAGLRAGRLTFALEINLVRIEWESAPEMASPHHLAPLPPLSPDA